MDQRKEHRINLAGWGLFVVSALFFIGASLRAGDALATQRRIRDAGLTRARARAQPAIAGTPAIHSWACRSAA